LDWIRKTTVLFCIFMVAGMPAFAQEGSLEPLPEKIVAEFEQALALIEDLKADVAVLDARSVRSEEVMEEVMIARRDLLWTAVVQNTVNLARGVAAQRDLNRDVSGYWDPMVEELSGLPDRLCHCRPGAIRRRSTAAPAFQSHSQLRRSR
jgi:hypothetical protein